MNALTAQVNSIHSGDLKRAEELLISQAQTLDTIFHQLVRRSVGNMGQGHYLQAADTYMRSALRAQSQCRATLETLAVIKNPTPIAFVRQANIAHGAQQVNNAAQPVADAPRARENEIAPSKQSGGSHELLQDARASTLAGGINPQMEALGAVNGAEDRSRQGTGV